MNRSLPLFLAAFLSASVIATEASTPRSVILIIGDGFDDQHVTMGRNYLSGMSGELLLDQLPFRGAVQVETLSDLGSPVYVADSANTATAIATGSATEIGRISTDIEDRDLTTIAERALSAGYRVGVITTASLTDATPAAFLAHVSARSCEGPEEILGSTYYGVEQPACPQDAKQNGGPGSIAEQLIESGAHVLLGGGEKFFSQTLADGETVFQSAERHGFGVARSRDALLNAKIREPILGVFDSETLEVRWRGEGGRKAEPVQTSWLNSISKYLGSVSQPEPMTCEGNPEYAVTPSLAEMTEIALAILEKDNEQGFFLMIESASIDKQSHKRNPCGSIGEIAQLEEALQLAMAFQERQPDTFIVVTADHAQAAQIVPDDSLYSRNPIPIYSPGQVARLRTPEGGLMRINYATNNIFSEEHTGANVPLFANAIAAPMLEPFMRQRDLYHAMAEFLIGSTDPE